MQETRAREERRGKREEGRGKREEGRGKFCLLHSEDLSWTLNLTPE